jgi:glycogen phosphorylase
MEEQIVSDRLLRHQNSVKSFQKAFADNLLHAVGRFPAAATPNDRYLALAYSVRDRLLERWSATVQMYRNKRSRTVCYLSAEFLLGPQLGSNLLNLGVTDEARGAMEDLGYDFDALVDQEEEPGLGNGGLGRLAACFMESLATLQIPAIGYGIRYEFGIFDQEIRDGWQIERTDKWLRLGNPWAIPRPEITFPVRFGGRTEPFRDQQGRYQVRWIPEHVVMGVPQDTPVVGYRVNTVNLLRLWTAQAAESFDFELFNKGEYYRAVEEKVRSENITKVLYPNDEGVEGKRLRLEQQYFFVSCSLQDMIRLYRQSGRSLERFHEKYAIQLNDTHPAIAVAELMRLLIDEHGLDWGPAWHVTRSVFGYTNHTLLPEALEKWPVGLFGSMLPRLLEIIYEINRRHLEEVRVRFPGDEGRVERLSLIDESGERYVRMAHLACTGSHSINGVARLHSELLKQDTLRDFFDLWPDRFTSVTNGVTPRRFLTLINPALAGLLFDTIGESWPANLDELRKLEPLVDDPSFRELWAAVKHANKHALASEIKARTGVVVDPSSLFDVQVKRIHEYKRQHLNVLHVIALYHRLRSQPNLELPPRTVIFAGKAAPGYETAKRIIKLIHAVGEVVNSDPAVKDRLKVVFLPDYNVKNAQRIFPAADLSEQISTAGKEASGTGNMKLSLNGAVTIGTLDGANIEIREEVGAENFFLFGLTAGEVARLKAEGYRPRDYYSQNAELRDVLDALASGAFSRGDRTLFSSLVQSLLDEDPFMLLADFAAYVERQTDVALAFANPDRWIRLSILNAARAGRFSSDRAIREYCERIWHVGPQPIVLENAG